jgi:hypothetical protein
MMTYSGLVWSLMLAVTQPSGELPVHTMEAEPTPPALNVNDCDDLSRAFGRYGAFEHGTFEVEGCERQFVFRFLNREDGVKFGRVWSDHNINNIPYFQVSVTGRPTDRKSRFGRTIYEVETIAFP